jgi:hypothetical protein
MSMETFPKKYGGGNDSVNKPQETQHETSEAEPVESSCVSFMSICVLVNNKLVLKT